MVGPAIDAWPHPAAIGRMSSLSTFRACMRGLKDGQQCASQDVASSSRYRPAKRTLIRLAQAASASPMPEVRKLTDGKAWVLFQRSVDLHARLATGHRRLP